MSSDNEVYVTSRSRTPSVIEVTSQVISQNKDVFAKLPDLMQEASVSTEFSSSRLQVTRVQNSRVIDSQFLTNPMFFIRPRTDSGVDLPDLTVTDEKILGKYGSDLTANFADIKAYGPNAFFQKLNSSDQTKYSICVCATGYIWVYVAPPSPGFDREEHSNFEIQIGTFALKARAITTTGIQCQYKFSRFRPSGFYQPQDGQLALLCATVLAKYLRLRMMGRQYEEAAEAAIKSLQTVDTHEFEDLHTILKKVCANAPMPPESDVSLISRSMITRRWHCWRETSVLRKRYFFPQRVVRCFRTSQHDSMDLLSGCFNALTPKKPNLPFLHK